LNLSDDETSTSKYVNKYRPQNYSNQDNDNDIPMAVYRQPQIVVAEEDDYKNDFVTSNNSLSKTTSSNVIATTNANVNKTSLIDKKKQKWIQDIRKFVSSLLASRKVIRYKIVQNA
jgi:hypothetical protein